MEDDRVYRLVYVISLCPVLRQRLAASVDDSSPSVSNALAMLWGPSQSPYTHQVIAAFRGISTDPALADLVSKADLRNVLATGTRSGFFLPPTPSGIPGADLTEIRGEAVAEMVPDSSRLDSLSERIDSSNNPLWFAAEAQRLGNASKQFIKTQKAVVQEYETFDQLLSNPQIADRAARQVLCAELALATGLLEVMVLDDSVTTDAKGAPGLAKVSTNALRFRNAYSSEKSASTLYDAWRVNMEAHNKVLRVFRKLMEVAILNVGRAPYDSIVRCIAPIPSIRLDDGRTIYPDYNYVKAKMRDTKFRSSILEAVQNVATELRTSFDQLMSPTYRFSEWLIEYTIRLRESAGKVFVFHLPPNNAPSKPRVMRPGWHMYAARDRGNPNDEAPIKRWMSALLNTGIESKDFAPIDLKGVDRCESIFERAADMLGIEGQERDAMRKLACRTTGSCLDAPYVAVRDNEALVDAEEKSNALARSLLDFRTLGCGDEENWTASEPIAQVLCKRRVAQSCNETSLAECGASTYPGDNDEEKIGNMLKDVCSPKSQLLRRVAECQVADEVGSPERFRDDAACLKRIVSANQRSRATCLTDLGARCGNGREGWCLIRALEGEPSPVSEVCRQYEGVGSVAEMLEGMKTLPPAQRTVCRKLQRITEVGVDERLRELAVRILEKTNIEEYTELNVDADHLTEFVARTRQSLDLSKDPPYDAKWLPEGLLYSPDEYTAFKNAYITDQIMTPSPDASNLRMTAIFDMLDVQSVGMFNVTTQQLASGPYGVSTYANRMLYPRFDDMRTRVPSDLYIRVVGAEYVDWMLLILGHYTKRQDHDDRVKDDLKTAIKNADDLWGTNYPYATGVVGGVVKRSSFIANPGVFQHMYRRLSDSVFESGRLGQSLGIDVELIVRLNELVVVKQVIGNASRKAAGEKYDEFVKELNDGFLNAKDLKDRRFNYAQLRKWDQAWSAGNAEKARWWRGVLTMATFAPSTSLAKDHLIALENTRGLAANMSWTQLYAAMLCVATSANDIRYAEQILVEVMETKLPRPPLAQDVIFENSKVQNHDAPSLMELSKVVVGDYVQDRAPEKIDDTLTSKIRSMLDAKDAKDEASIIFSLVCPRETNDGSQLEAIEQLNQTLQKIRQGTTKKRSTYKSSFLQDNAIIAPFRMFLSPLAWFRENSQTSSAISSMGDEDYEKIANTLFVTAQQSEMYTLLGKRVQAREVLENDLALLMVLKKYGLYDMKLPSANVSELSELVHAARFTTRAAEGGMTSSIKFKDTIKWSDLLPSNRLNASGTLSKADVALVREYSEALVLAVPAFIATHDRTTGQPLNRGESMIEALYRVAYPLDVEKKPRVNVFANAIQDMPDADKLYEPLKTEINALNNVVVKRRSEALDAYQKLRLYGVALDRPNGMLYIPLNEQDRERVSDLITDAGIQDRLNLLRA